MVANRSARSPLEALLFGVALIAGTSVLGQGLFTLVVQNREPAASFGGVLSLLPVLLQAALGAAVILGGIYAAFELDRFDRPLLVVGPGVFLVALLVNAGLVAVTVLTSGPTGPSFPAQMRVMSAFSGALYQSAIVVAVVVLVRSLVDESVDAGGAGANPAN